jgi:hypothetical protein
LNSSRDGLSIKLLAKQTVFVLYQIGGMTVNHKNRGRKSRKGASRKRLTGNVSVPFGNQAQVL